MALKVSSTNFLVAQAAALILDAAMATEVLIKGLTGLTLPLGFEMTSINVQEMGRRIDLVVPSGGTYTSIDITANFVPGDPSQQRLQTAAINSTKLTTMRFYLKVDCDFAALDLINDSGGAYLIGTYSPPTVASKNELFQNSISILPAGSSVLFVAHSAPGLGTNISFTADAGSGAIAELSAGTWAGFGFEAGDVCIIDYQDGQDPLYAQAETVSGTTLTFSVGIGDADSITTAAGIATTQVHGATPIEVAGTTTTCD